MKFVAIFICILAALPTQSQSLEIQLDSLSTLDDESIQITVLSDEPREELILPANIPPHKYLTLFYTFESENDELISIAVVQNDSTDILYIDFNNDEDLTNDGPPVVFSLDDNEQVINIKDDYDPKQVTKLVLYRKPPFGKAEDFFEENGNLKKHIATMFGTATNQLNFMGEDRTYYFDDRITLKRGQIKLDSIFIFIGLFDYNNNGLFNDPSDILIIDVNQDGKLSYLQDEDIFKFEDVIKLGDRHYEVTDVDKYGNRIVLSATDKNETKYFSIWNREIKYESEVNELNPDFWDYTLIDINGNEIEVHEMRGKYLLLNFWGEWCAPCRAEIPDLIKASEKYSDKLVILGFLKTYDLIKAEKFIADHNINWTQIELTNEIETNFNIRSYPTNILIMPNGKTFLKEGMVKENYFSEVIK